MSSHHDINHPNPWALLPLALFFVLYAVTFFATGDMGNLPIGIAFLLATAASMLTTKGKLSERIATFCRGAANETVMLMVLIFVLAGAFAATATATGAVAATVNMALRVLPESMLPAGIFIAACFISLAMGTSCGTIAALTPIAAGIAPQIGMGLPAMVGIVVGGAMFGDNLSFISDTTIVATRTQDVEMRDKFRVNVRMVLPVALIAVGIYVWQGFGLSVAVHTQPVEWLKIVPYLVVLITALLGVNVIVVLVLGLVLAGLAGLIAQPDFTVWTWGKAAESGIVGGMGELIIVSLLASGMFALVQRGGGIAWLVALLAGGRPSRRGAEVRVALLTAFTNLCTANNTIALLIAGPIAKRTGSAAGIDSRRMAGLLDTVSCSVQALLPYGAQLLIASGLAAGVEPVDIVPHLYYPMLLGIAVAAAIALQRPRRWIVNCKL